MNDRFEGVTTVKWRAAVLGEGTQHNGPLAGQHAGLVQLQQGALDSVRMLVDIFQEEHPILDFWEMRCAQQSLRHGQIAPPQAPNHVQAIKPSLGTETDGLQFSGHGLDKTFLGDVIAAFGRVVSAKVVTGHRASPESRRDTFARLGRTGGLVRQGCELQCGDVAVAHPGGALFDTASDLLEVEGVEQTAQAIAATCGQCHGRRSLCHAVNGVSAGGVVTRETLVLGQGRGINRWLKPQGGQALGGPTNRRRSRHDARWAVNDQLARHRTPANRCVIAATTSLSAVWQSNDAQVPERCGLAKVFTWKVPSLSNSQASTKPLRLNSWRTGSGTESTCAR